MSMRRELFNYKRSKFVSGCCPGHDDYPGETYSSNRSKRARSRDIAKEHQFVRTLQKRQLLKIIQEEVDTTQ